MPDRHNLWWWVFPVVTAVAVVAALVVGSDGDNVAVTSSPSPPTRSQIGAVPCSAVESVAGLVIDPDRLGTGSLLDRRDEAADVDGPWTVVVRRRPDGSLGQNGAVVTFPVDAPPPGRTVAVGVVTGVAGDRMVTWPIAGAHARVRGDLSEPELLRIASATGVVDRRPVVEPVDGLRVVSNGPYRTPSIHEVRYQTSSLGEDEVLGNGLVSTGVLTGGGFEDQLYARQASPAGVVHCRPAVTSSVLGGNASLAWEPLPGTVAYVGYSGAAMDAWTLAALQRLAERCRVLSDSEWRATRPDARGQTNKI